MKICDLQSHVGRLQRETKKLRDQWEQTQQFWQDATARQFEEKYLAPLIPALQLTLAAVHELAESIEHAEQELGDPLE
jgi:uncharacterized protein YukE